MANKKSYKTKRYSFLLKLIPVAFYALLILFLFFYLKSIDFSQFKTVSINWYYMLLASVIGILDRFFTVAIWLVLLSSLGATDLLKSLGELTYVYAKSWMGRYIPGTAPWILGKIYFASKHGISKNKLAVSSVLEGALQITVVMAVAFVMLIFDKRLDVVGNDFKLLMIGVLVVCILAIFPPFFNRLMALPYRMLKRKALHKDDQASASTIGRGTILFVISSFFSGFALFFVAKAVYPSLGYHELLFVMAVGNLASAASMLAIFAPSGIGVREGIQLVLLTVIMPKEIALVIVVITRLWNVVMDLVFLGLAWLMRRYSFNTT